MAGHWLIAPKADFEEAAIGPHSAWQLRSMEDPTIAESVWPLGLHYATRDEEKSDVFITSKDQPKNTTESTAAAAAAAGDDAEENLGHWGSK